MKKTLILAAAALISASAFAQTVTSANIVGYVKVDKPGNGDLNIVGVSFTSTNQTLTSLLANGQFEGSFSNPNACDQVIIWSTNQSYSTYVYLDYLPEYPAYAAYNGWQEYDKFGTSEYADPVIPAGTAFWIRGSQTVDTNVVMAGDVPVEETATAEIVTGLQHLANPFSSDVTLDELDLDLNATGDYSNPNACDQIIVWNAETQSYTTYVYLNYLPDYPAYAAYNGWQAYDDFGTSTYADDVVIPVGSGFWYRAQSNFTWTVSNQYYSAVQ